jgi:hypothetical protein
MKQYGRLDDRRKNRIRIGSGCDPIEPHSGLKNCARLICSSGRIYVDVELSNYLLLVEV